MKKEDLNVRNNWTKTPLVLGMAAVLSMPAAFSYANVSEATHSDVVQTVLQSRTIKGQILDENGEPLTMNRGKTYIAVVYRDRVSLESDLG